MSKQDIKTQISPAFFKQFCKNLQMEHRVYARDNGKLKKEDIQNMLLRTASSVAMNILYEDNPELKKEWEDKFVYFDDNYNILGFVEPHAKFHDNKKDELYMTALKCLEWLS